MEVVNQFVEMCHQLRVLNNVREEEIGIPITYKQYPFLGLVLGVGLGVGLVATSEPPIKDIPKEDKPPNKGQTKITSERGKPLYKGQNAVS